jgi:hypothetical protein
MATTYAADTTANQAVVDTMVASAAAFAIDLQNLNKKYAAALAYWFNGNPQGSTPSTIVNGYTAGSAIPNNTGYAGKTGVTNTGLETLVGYLQTVNGLFDSAHTNVMVPFAGPTNL